MKTTQRIATRLSLAAGATLVAGSMFLGGCLYAGPEGIGFAGPPVAISVGLARPGWTYYQERGDWYYARRGERHHRHDYYAYRGGHWRYHH
jgi:hypothetical protein